jgi:hypothetical protein
MIGSGLHLLLEFDGDIVLDFDALDLRREHVVGKNAQVPAQQPTNP